MTNRGVESGDTPTTEVVRLWAPWVVPVLRTPVRNACVTIRNGTIAAVDGGVSQEQAKAHGATCFENSVIAPGFVNAHAHIEYAAYDALVDGLDFPDWIADHVHRKQRLDSKHMGASALLGAQQCAAGGITCVGDASYSGHAAGALVAVGLRGRVYLEVFGEGAEPLAGRAELAASIQDIAQESHGLIDIGWSPHAPYTAGPELYAAVHNSGLPWMSHVAESPTELDCTTRSAGPLAAWIRSMGWTPHAWPAAPAHHLARGGLLGRHVVLVHAVHLADEELEAVANAGAAIAHCPRSNARLGCGRADLARFERAGVLVGLGTDSPASAGPIDMFAEMRSCIEQHRSAETDARWPDAARVLRMATLDAAQVLGYDNMGAVVEGAAADVMVVETGPTADPVTSLVLGGTPEDVRCTMVAGREVWHRDRNHRELEAARAGIHDARALLTLPVARTDAASAR